MSESAKFKINIKTGEIEISGSETFVEARIETLSEILELISGTTIDTSAGVESEDITENGSSNPSKTTKPNGIPETFGEWMHSFKDGIKDLEKALITARFVQSQSSDNDFKTSEVNKSLKDHGIKLSNPSQSLKQLDTKKFLFQTRKVGSLRYMRVSQDGQAHLESLKRES